MTLIERLRARYESIRTELDTITNTAAADGEHGRSLNDTESARVRALSDEATALVPQIEQEVARLERDAQTQAMFARVAVNGPGANTGARSLPVRETAPGEPLNEIGAQNAGVDGGAEDAQIRAQVQTGNAQTRERDPGIYVRSATIETGDHRGERSTSLARVARSATSCGTTRWATTRARSPCRARPPVRTP